jgi:hypothetical protein
MATVYEDAAPAAGRPHEDAGMAFGMALAMAAVIVAGFSLNLAMGRSSFAVPAIYHIHGVAFFSWTALFVTQTRLAASGNLALHRRLGRLAGVLLPVLVLLGAAMVVTSLRRTGGPFFFDQSEFLWGNLMGLACLAGLVVAAVRHRLRTDWHARLMLSGMAILTGPGLGRILPMPLFMPWAWWVNTAVALLFPLAGMIIDLRRKGRIHRAWLWGMGAIVAAHLVGEAIGFSAPGRDFTAALVAGTPGGARPMAAFLP